MASTTMTTLNKCEDRDNHVDMMFEGVEDFNDIFEMKKVGEALVTSLFPSTAIEDENEGYDDEIYDEEKEQYTDQLYTRFDQFRREGFLFDVTLLVGPGKTPIKAHKILLANFSDYFKAMFTKGTKESTQDEILLPKIDSETMESVMCYAYQGYVKLNEKNVLKIAAVSSFFGAPTLDSFCQGYIEKYMNRATWSHILQFAERYGLVELKESAVLFFQNNISNIFTFDLELINVSFHLLLDIMKRPGTVVSDDQAENELQLFRCLWNSCAKQSEEEQIENVPKILEAVHLPLVGGANLDYIETKVGHIERARDLIEKARPKMDLETRVLKSLDDPRNHWIMPRYRTKAIFETRVMMSDYNQGLTTFSEAVFLDSLQWCISFSKANQKAKMILHCLTPVELPYLSKNRIQVSAWCNNKLVREEFPNYYGPDIDDEYSLDLEETETDISMTIEDRYWRQFIRRYPRLEVDVTVSL